MNCERRFGAIRWIAALLTVGVVLLVDAGESRAEFIVILDDRTAFEALLTVRSNSTTIDTDGRFAPDPATGTVDSLTRSGTIGGESYRYQVSDVDFSNTPNGRISSGTIGDDIDDVDRVSVEVADREMGVRLVEEFVPLAGLRAHSWVREWG